MKGSAELGAPEREWEIEEQERFVKALCFELRILAPMYQGDILAILRCPGGRRIFESIV